MFNSIQKALDDFLEKKRETFQRFFFLSNAELLEILSTAKTPLQMQPYLKKVFENVDHLELSDNQATGIVSAEGEVLVLKSCFFRVCEIEELMNHV